MKRIVLLLLVLLFLLSAQNVSAESDTDYYIRDLHVEVIANPDRSYEIVETIDVWFEEPSYGIVRKIPTWSWLERFTIKDFQAVGDPYFLESENLLRVGAPDVSVTGQKTYTIKYTLLYYADDDPGADHFFLNLIDTEWAVRIENFSARITLPESAVVEGYALTGGEYGKESPDLADVTVSGNVIVVEGLKEVQKWSGIALNARLPEGTFYAAGVWTPPLVVERLNTYVNFDEYGVMSIVEHYQAKVNAPLIFDRHVSGYEGYRGRDVISFSDAEPERVIYFPIAPSKVNSVSVTDPSGREITGTSALDLSDYVGQSIDFSVSYVMENRLRESMSDVGFFLQLMKGYYTEMRVDNLELTVSAPFDILRIYGGGGGAMRQVLDEPVIDGNRMTAQSIEPFDNQDINYVIEFKDAGFIRKANTIDFTLPIAMLAAMLCVLFFAFLHKREKPIVPVIEFYPPEGMNPAEVGYIIDERITGRDVTSLLYYWAAHGHLNIEITQGKGYILHRLNELDEGHADYEREMFSALWKHGAKRNSVSSDELKDYFYFTVKTTAGSVKNSFSGERALYRKGRSPIVATSFFILSIGFAAFFVLGQFVDYVAGVFPIRPLFGADKRFGEYENDFYTMFIFVLFALLITMYLSTNFYRSDRALKTASGALRRIICLALSIAGTVMFTIVCGDGKILLTIPALISIASLFIIVNALPFIARLSDFGVHSRGLCLGFKSFLFAAEKQRLEMLLKENPDYYYNILAYAQVLGVSKIWQSKFDRLIISPSSFIYGTDVDPMVYNRINEMNKKMRKTRSRRK